ncbi:hypothetical protein HTZ77_21480 [Nonomuraea sp. SMC257]|uniref:Uncharacterized protein n=1 Tax=Nonomuraea montanisoli TaxID=2741721 RepID=A0A7Y6IAP8_9ACTN|nr:hypothetical protein [Nonomuraea montanisoli]NUW33985.1 hypothetical protein [Nonomuraea montanisoli]
MGDGQGFSYQGNPFETVSAMLDDMGVRIGSLAHAGGQVALPTLALGLAGEWPARSDYGKIWDELREEFRYGDREAATLAEKMRRTGHGYDSVEEANGAMSTRLGRIFDAVHKAQSAPRPHTDPYAGEDDPYTFDGPRDRPFPWRETGGEVVALGGLAGRGAVGSAQDALDRRVGQERALIAADRRLNAGTGRRFAERVEQEQLSRLAKATERTRLNITTAKAFSWWAIAAGLAWSAVVIPSDEDIDRAIAGWNSIADHCAELFGYDTGPVRDAVEAAWAGAAMQAADARIVDFVAAGVHVTERTRRLAQALSQTVHDLDRIFMAMLIFSGASAAAIVGLGLAARVNPALRPAVEILGGRLGIVAMLSANLVPVLTAAIIAWHREADANRTTKIGDREITGFRRS